MGGQHPDSPILIGGTGGSGTRALYHALTEAGVRFSRHSNSAGDARDFFSFYDDRINATLNHTRSLNYGIDGVPPEVREASLSELRDTIARYASTIDVEAGPWGIKGPRSMYALPYFNLLIPTLRFVHVVRDGRDMALSRNQGQVRRHFEALFGHPPEAAPAIAAARLWSKANVEAADWAETNLGARYMRLKYEDLCAAPQATLARVFDFLGWSPGELQRARAASVIRASGTVGRWHSLAEEECAAITAAAREGLARFGYLESGKRDVARRG